MVKVVFYELEKFGLSHKQQYIRSHLKGHEVEFIKEPLSEKTAVKDADIVACFIYSKINAVLLKKLPKMKLLCTMSTGYDHIDLVACKKAKVTVCNVPSYGENTVAEHAMALLLAISRKIIPSVERTKKGDFSLEDLRGFDLKGKTLGILGTGKIGRHMAHFAESFGMKVIAFDKFPNESLAKECGFTYKPFDKVLSDSDVVSVHLPETKETHHIINRENLKKFKKGCVLINTARGGIIETEALLAGLKDGTFSALGLDVLEEESVIKEELELVHEEFQKKVNYKTLLEEHILMNQENVFITPHNAFNSEEAILRIVDTTLNSIVSFVSGVPTNKV